jgi:acyl-CoA synthetase (AMP-forming)/AMP-acid ligase II
MTALRTMAGLIDRQAEERGDAVAIRFNDRSTTFRELDEVSNRIANALISEGLQPGDRIAIFAKNSDQYLALILAAAKSRVCAVTLNWRLAPAEIAYILEHSEAKLLFIETEFLDAHAQTARQAPTLKLILELQTGGAPGPAEEWWMRRPASPPTATAAASDDFVQMYTSGTTGLPKGVVLSHGGYIAAYAAVEQLPWAQYDASDVIFPPSPFFHVSGLNVSLRALHRGARLVLRPVFMPSEMPLLIASEGITRTLMVPAVIAQLLAAPGTRDIDFSRLKSITYGGSPMPPPVLEEARRVFNCDFIQGYGLTETGGQATFLSPEDHRAGGAVLASCGRPTPGCEVRVCDAEGDLVPAGTVGEIQIRSTSLMKGYWRNDEATRATFVDGWLKTGDAGYLDADGYLYIHDRVKDMIVSGGENIYPTEVENALSSHPAVAEVAVIGVPDEKWGEAVKALVVLKSGSVVTEAELIAHARQRIAGYKLPKSVDFVAPLPRNASGKILRRSLREPFWVGRDRQVG